VVGAGQVGAHVALLLAQRDYADLVVLDADDGRAGDAARDVAQASALLDHEPRIAGTDDWAEASGSNIVVLTADRDVITASVGDIARRCPDAVVIVVSEPVEEMCTILRDATLFTRSHVFGVVGIAQTARLRAAIAEEADVSIRDVTALVLGGPGGHAVPLLSHTTVAGQPVRRLLDGQRLSGLAARVAEHSDSATLAAAVRVAVDAIIGDTRRVLVCTALCQGEFGIQGRFAGVPVRIGREGIYEFVDLTLDEREHRLLTQAAAAGA
jgi:malate dehydrogenase